VTAQDRSTNKSRFEDGDKPAGSAYVDLIDSFLSVADSTAQSLTSDLSLPKLIATTEVSSPQVNATEVSASAGRFTNVTASNIAASGGDFTSVSAVNIRANNVSASSMNVGTIDNPVQLGPAGTRGRALLIQQVDVSGNNTKKSVTLPGGSDIHDIKFRGRATFEASAGSQVDIRVGTSADDVKFAQRLGHALEALGERQRRVRPVVRIGGQCRGCGWGNGHIGSHRVGGPGVRRYRLRAEAMSTADVNKSVRGIVNEVQRRLGVTETSALGANKLSTMLVDFLNDTLDECSDLGEWKQFYRNIKVSAISSTGEYEVATSAPVKNVDQVYIQGRASPLNPVDFREIIRLRRTSSHGTPHSFAVVETSGVNPKIYLHPIPGTNQDGKIIDVHCFEKQRLYSAVTADSSAIPNFPSRMLVQGTYAKAILEEAGQEETDEYKGTQKKYERMQREAYNRLTADTGGDLYLIPGQPR
jgi:hypothetical protein